MTLPRPVQTNPLYMNRLTTIESADNIPEQWKGTPIESLILSENFGIPISADGDPKLLIVACIEFRYALPIPRMFAYVLRRASGRLVGSEFTLAYALAKGVRHVAIIGHDDCGMTKVAQHREQMIAALTSQGWYRDRAEEYINQQAARYSIEDEIESLRHEYLRLRRIFRKVSFAPLFVSLSDTKLHIPNWYLDMLKSGEPEHHCDLVHDEDLLTLS